MPRCFLKKVFFILLLTLLLLSSGGPVLAAFEEDMETLGLYYDSKDLVVSATRSPRPISQSAENITVITAKEIEMMGAHTLVDVFANVPGIQATDRGGVGSLDDLYILGANYTHVLYLLDGVALNQWVDQYIDLPLIPIQNIERVEIIKGPASSSWGSALGGVVNIVTKSPMDDRKLGGTLSFSGGERGTRDTRGELSGMVGPLGYYLFAGNMVSRGFQRNTAFDQSNLYAKLIYDLPNQGSLQFTTAYDSGGVGDGFVPEFKSKLRRNHFLATLSGYYPLTDSIDLDLSLRINHNRSVDHGNWTMDIPDYGISAGDPLDKIRGREDSQGGSAKLTWRWWKNTLVGGFDYDHLDIFGGENQFGDIDLISDKYGLFLNDTLVLGDLTITPSFRYDRMRPLDDFFSPSVGVAWNPTEKITLRTYWAKGYSLPMLQPDSTQEKVTTVQAGIETTYIPWLWLKTTFFWNRLKDVQNFETSDLEKQRKLGVEVEARTTPVFNTSLSAGYTYLEGESRETDEELTPFPHQIVKMGLHYNDVQHSLRGTLLGRYVCGNSPYSTNAKTSAMLLDLNLAKKVFTWNKTGVELFFNAHNLFNGAQFTLDSGFKNARRWFEGGIKFEF